MTDERVVNEIVLNDLRSDIRKRGLVSALFSCVGYPFLNVYETYIGPGRWEKNDFNMSHEETRQFVERHPESIERIDLAENEVLVKSNVYWGPLCSRTYSYRLRKEQDTWNVKNKELIGMS